MNDTSYKNSDFCGQSPIAKNFVASPTLHNCGYSKLQDLTIWCAYPKIHHWFTNDILHFST